MNDHSQREHADHSPSSLEPKELCPSWRNKESDSSVYADDGERCHMAAEAKIKGDDAPQAALPEAMAFFVQEVYDYVAPRIAGSERIITETRLFHKHPLLREKCHGTADLHAITGKTAQLIDFKFGRRPVTNAKENIQGWAYALALFDTYEEIEEITTHFVAPRVNNGTSHATFTRTADYDRLLARVLRVAERACLPDAERSALQHASWASCIYCGNKAGCSALARIVEEALNLSAEKEFTAAKLREVYKKVDGETPDELAFSYEVAAVIKDWAEQRQAYVKQKAMEGQEVQGYELRFTKGRTTVKTVDKVLAAGIDLPLEEAIKYATIPVADLKKLYTKGVDSSEKTEKERELMEKLAKGDALKSGEESNYLFRVNEKE